jgi:hypothetical protein
MCLISCRRSRRLAKSSALLPALAAAFLSSLSPLSEARLFFSPFELEPELEFDLPPPPLVDPPLSLLVLVLVGPLAPPPSMALLLMDDASAASDREEDEDEAEDEKEDEVEDEDARGLVLGDPARPPDDGWSISPGAKRINNLNNINIHSFLFLCLRNFARPSTRTTSGPRKEDERAQTEARTATHGG